MNLNDKAGDISHLCSRHKSSENTKNERFIDSFFLYWIDFLLSKNDDNAASLLFF